MTPADTALTHSRPQHRRRGFNLIEAAIVLGVVGLVIGGIWVAASAVQENRKLNQTVNAVLLIYENTRQLVSRSAVDIYGLTNQSNPLSAVILKGIDGLSIVTGGVAQLPYGTVSSTYGAPSNISADFIQPTRIQVTVNGLGKSQCIKLVSAITSRYKDSSVLISVLIGMTPYSTYPFVPTQAQCSFFGGDPTSITFTFEA